MDLQSCVPAAQLPAGSPGAGRAGRAVFPIAARRLAKLAVVVTIAAAFVEVVLNPAAFVSAIHFWLALFFAAVARGEEESEMCRS